MDTTVGARTDQQAVENRVREKRQLLGLSQKRLADLAGVARQSICAIEAGLYSPATSIALRLARALHCGVEDLFALKAEDRLVEAQLIGRLPADARKIRAKLSRVGDRLLVRPLLALGGFTGLSVISDGLIVGCAGTGKQVKVQLLRDRQQIDRQIVVAGCDPAMVLAAEYLRRGLNQDCVFPCMMGSSAAIAALRRGEVHIAGVHLGDGESKEWNMPYLRRHVKGMDCLVVTFAVWEEGLIVARGNPKGIRGVNHLGRRDVRLINREPGSGARHLLDRQIVVCDLGAGKVRGYENEVSSHLEVAWIVKLGVADVGVGVMAAASLFDLDFIPLCRERYDFVIPQAYYDTHPSLQAFLDIIVSGSFRAELEALGGYDTRETGNVRHLKAA